MPRSRSWRPAFSPRSCGAGIRHQRQQDDAATILLDNRTANDFLDLVAGALDQNVGFQFRDQSERRFGIEQDHGVDEGERRHHPSPRAFRLHRPRRPLKTAHGSVAVQRHDQPIAVRASFGQELEMTFE